jgi:hypothetical protein
VTDTDTGGSDDRAAGWEYNIVHTDRLGSPAGPQLALIWKRKYADGTTDWDQISRLGREGWEMVNAFPVESSGTLQYLAFIFKRRIAPAGAAPPVEPVGSSAAESEPASTAETGVEAESLGPEPLPGATGPT